MELREPAAADAERIAAVVESAMTTSHRLSPQQIERVVDAEFGGDAVTEKHESEGTLVRVAETDEDVEETTLVGYVEGTVEGDTGELSWLFVDPEHRGKGIGTELFESMRAALEDAGASTVRAVALDANTEGGRFFEQFGLARADEREVEVGDESLVELVFAADAERDGDADGEWADLSADDLPETETTDGTTTSTSEDGETVYVARDERESGTEAPFLVAYTDEAGEQRFGYYCANCGSLDVSMDDTDRLKCPDCGNAHASRSSESYDDSYL